MAKTLTVYLAADIGKFQKELNKAQGGLGGFSDSLKKIGAAVGIAFGARELLDFGKQAIQLASDFEQASGAADQLFGQTAADQARAWAETTTKSMGLSQDAALEAQNSFGAFAKAAELSSTDAVAFAQDLTGVAADLSAAFGGTVPEAIDAISSSLRGQQDPIEKYSILLNAAAVEAEASALGFEKVGNSLSAQAKIIATTNLIKKQADLLGVTGQNAREADTFAGSTQRVNSALSDLQLAFGTGLIDGMEDFGSAASDTTDALIDMRPAVQDLGQAIGEDLNTSAQDFIEIGGIVSDTWDAWQYEARRADSVLIGLIRTVGKNNKDINALARANRGAVQSFEYAQYAAYDLKTALDDTSESAGAANDAITSTGNAALDAGRKAATAGKGFYAFWEAALNAEKLAREANSMSGTVLGAINEGFLKGPDPDSIRRMNAFQAEINALNASLSGGGGGGGGAAGAADKASKRMDQLRDALRGSAAALDEQVAAVEKASEALSSYADSVAKDLLGGVDLKGVFSEENAAKTIADFTQQITDVTVFSSKIAQLGTQLPSTPGAQLLLSQILNLGATSGTKFIDSLSLEVATNLVKKLDFAVTATNGNAYLLGEKFYGEGVYAAEQTLEGMVVQLQKDEKKIIKIGKKIGQPIGSEIRSEIATAIGQALSDASSAISRWKVNNSASIVAELKKFESLNGIGWRS